MARIKAPFLSHFLLLPVPRLPILLFVFLAVHVHVHVLASHAIPPLPTAYDGSICSESFMCGGVSISYPFYLSNATRDTTDYRDNYSCGYTDLKVSCQGEGLAQTPVITLDDNNYTVRNIYYDAHTIILADSDALAAGNCPAVRHEVSFDETWLLNTSSNDNLTFLFGCYPRRMLSRLVSSHGSRRNWQEKLTALRTGPRSIGPSTPC